MPIPFSLRKSHFLSLTAAAVAWLSAGTALLADSKAEAEEGARTMARDFEKEGYVYRAEAWIGELSPNFGKAVKVQLFKGNEYSFCVAVPRDSGVRITGEVLDFQGKPVGEIQPLLEGWGMVLFFKPRKTGTYVVTVRQTPDGKQKVTSCAIVTGYK